jgi:hypothetical protein
MTGFYKPEYLPTAPCLPPISIPPIRHNLQVRRRCGAAHEERPVVIYAFFFSSA